MRVKGECSVSTCAFGHYLGRSVIGCARCHSRPRANVVTEQAVGPEIGASEFYVEGERLPGRREYRDAGRRSIG